MKKKPNPVAKHMRKFNKPKVIPDKRNKKIDEALEKAAKIFDRMHEKV